MSANNKDTKEWILNWRSNKGKSLLGLSIVIFPILVTQHYVRQNSLNTFLWNYWNSEK